MATWNTRADSSFSPQGAAQWNALLDRIGEIVSATDHGLSTSASASNNYSALVTAIGTGKPVYVPAGTYNIDPSGGVITTGNLIFGAGRNKTILNIAGNGDLFQRSSYSVLQDLTIDMNGGTYSGHACQFAASSAQQADRSIEILDVNSAKYALLFAADGGSQFYSDGSTYFTRATAGTAAAIKINGTDTAATPRIFIGTQSNGCTLWDFGGCNDFFIYGGFSNNLLFSSDDATKVLMMGVRIGTTSGTVTIKGDSHKIKGCVFADPVVLASGTTEIDFDSEAPSYNITDSGSNNSIFIRQATYVPTWTGSGSNPDLGDGTMIARYSREGSRVTVDIDLTMGGTTTYGTGFYSFTIPFAASSALVQVGTASMTDNNTSNYRTGNVVVASSATTLTVRVQNDGGSPAVGQLIPWTWAQSDILRLQVTYTAA